MENFAFSPIGVVHTAARFRSEAPRQAAFARMPGWIELRREEALRVAAADLTGFDRIWVLFVFHLNYGAHWKPKVRPPVAPGTGRYGVFATRSPHRPNPIGLSCVELLEVDGFRIHFKASDLLDGTPVLDIKPYIPEADSFPQAAAGWRDAAAVEPWQLEAAPAARERSGWLLEHGRLDLFNFCRVQLRYNPLDARRRLSVLDAAAGIYELGFRTWRIRFRPEAELRRIVWLDVVSNYRPEELAEDAPDPYQDKALHRAFIRRFGF